MLDGFRPDLEAAFFERRRGSALIGAIVLVCGPLAYGLVWEPKEETVEVQLEPEIRDFAVEEEPEQAEPEPELAPPPPPGAKVKVVSKPKPRPKPQTPISKPSEAADETGQEKTYEVGPSGSTDRPGLSNGGASRPKKPDPPPKPKKPDPPPPKRRAANAIDPTKPIDRPENATAPKPLGSNPQPKYPEKLRNRGVTGRVVIKLHVHRDGSVRGAKILSKKNSATTEDDKKEANKLFLAAVIKVVKTWKYKPATVAGKPISVWHTVTVPFNLTAG